MTVHSFLCVMAKFNRVFKMKMRGLQHNLQPISAEGRMVDIGFSARGGYDTPESNQILLGVVQRENDEVQIQLQQGPLILATADIDPKYWKDGPMCGLILQTNPLYMFNVYPLHVFAHEPDDFFQKSGYGRLCLYFALLWTISTRTSMKIICENPITSYILFILFRSATKGQTVDFETNIAKYFENLSQYEKSYGQIARFEDFHRFYSSHEEQYGRLEYLVHATETNEGIITNAIDEWTNTRISSVNDDKFMANFCAGPKHHEYKTNPALQGHFPQYTFKYALMEGL